MNQTAGWMPSTGACPARSTIPIHIIAKPRMTDPIFHEFAPFYVGAVIRRLLPMIGLNGESFSHIGKGSGNLVHSPCAFPVAFLWAARRGVEGPILIGTQVILRL